LIETDKDKKVDTHAKLYIAAVSALTRCGVVILFSNNLEQSAKILVNIATHEQKNGFGLQREILKAKPSNHLDFILSIPNLNCVNALKFLNSSECILDILNRTGEDISRDLQLSKNKSVFIRDYLHRNYCSNSSSTIFL